MGYVYSVNNDGKKWWCNSHNRFATYLCYSDIDTCRVCCEPGQSGVMIPCFVVEITNELEIWDN